MSINYEAAFAGLNEATADDKLPKYTNGDFRLQVDNVETNEHEEYGVSVFVEVTILESTNPKYPAGSKGTAKISNLSAQKKSSRDTAIKNLKRLLAAIFSIDVDSPQNWIGLLQMGEQHGLFKGATFYDDDVETKKSKAGHDFILHNFRADQENPRPLHVVLGELQKAG